MTLTLTNLFCSAGGSSAAAVTVRIVAQSLGGA